MILFRKSKVQKEVDEILHCSDNTCEEALNSMRNKLQQDKFVSLLTGGKLERKNEEAAKLLLIQRMLRTLGYDTTDENVILPEWKVNVNEKPKKVDYAISHDRRLTEGTPTILVEAKALNISIEGDELVIKNSLTPLGQLKRYFDNTPSAQIGILSNGDEYRFYCAKIEHLLGNSAHEMDINPIVSFKISDSQQSTGIIAKKLFPFMIESFEPANVTAVRDRALSYFENTIDKSVLSEKIEDAEQRITTEIIKEMNCERYITIDNAREIINEIINK